MDKIKDFLQYKRAINFYSRYKIERYNKHYFAIYSDRGVFQNLYALRKATDGHYMLCYVDGYIMHTQKTLDKAKNFIVKCLKYDNSIIA